MQKAYIAPAIFTGTQWMTHHAIIVDQHIILDIIPELAVPTDMPVRKLSHGFLAPAMIDLQIYGAYGKLFSVFPESDSLDKLYAYCLKGGAAWCMPTVATNSKDVFFKCMDAVRTYWNQGGQGILGLHLEGPWINAAKRGAHIETAIHTPTIYEVEEWLSYGEGIIKMITLAPEVCTPEIISLLRSHHIVLSAGHSNATYQQAKEGFSQGITAVTHLFNAMSPFHHRLPGLAGAAMDYDGVMVSIIPDGYHVDYAAIRIARKVLHERLFVITDAVTETSDGPYKHYLAGDKYEVTGILSGSALDMAKAVRNLVTHVGIGKEEALRMCSLYPARAIGKQNELGLISPGHSNKMVWMNDQLEVEGMLGLED